MQERVFGLEYEYGLSHLPAAGGAALGSDDASRLAVKVANERLRMAGEPKNNFWHNGGKLYFDMGHVEWATPECRSLREAVAYDKAGERLLASVASATEQAMAREGTRGSISVTKNNLDAHGNTFGCHENYLARRSGDCIDDPNEFFEGYLVRQLVPFLVARAVVCGSGAVVNGKFRVTQRAPFINSVTGNDTTVRRPLVNTRDEPHADGGRFRRLHLILGDANMAEWATYLKLGTTSLVLGMIEDAFLDFGDVPELEDPVAAMQAVSDDPGLGVALPLRGGGSATALEIQRRYLEAARGHLGGSPEGEAREVLVMWGEVLDALGEDPQSLAGKLDWVTKKLILDIEAGDGLGWHDPRMREVDFKYHGVRPETSLFYVYERQGLMARLVSDEEVERALRHPPPFTRARLRAEAMSRGTLVSNWDQVHTSPGRVHSLPSPLDWRDLAALRALGLDEEALVRWLAEGLDAESPSVRVEAVTGLALVGGAGALRLLLRACDDPDHRVRAAAVEALGKTRDGDATRRLEGATADAHYLVRLRAEEALGAAGRLR